MSGRPALVTGATSQVGVFALRRLMSAGHSVQAVSRQAHTDSAGQLAWFPSVNDVAPGAAALLSCGPLSLAADALDAHGPAATLERAVVVSTSSVLTKVDSRHPDEREQIAQIIDLERKIRDRCEQYSIRLCLLRPTLIYGCGLDRNLSRIRAFIDRFGFLPLAGKGGGLRQPLHADDLAAVVVSLCRLQPPAQLESPVCGGTTLSYREMVAAVFSSLGRRPVLLPLPPFALALAARFLPGLNPEMVKRQARDLVFDDSDLRRMCGVAARPFHPSPQDFRLD